MSGVDKKYFIIKDRVEIYKDFTINLLYYIIEYYLDKETLSEDEDIYNHYNWCFNKVCDEFIKEEIDFTDNLKLREYYYKYYYHQLYKSKAKQDISFNSFEKFWNNIFDIDKQKNKNIINIFVEIYTIFDESINSKKNVMNLI